MIDRKVDLLAFAGLDAIFQKNQKEEFTNAIFHLLDSLIEEQKITKNQIHKFIMYLLTGYQLAITDAYKKTRGYSDVIQEEAVWDEEH